MALQIMGLGHIPQRHLDASDLNASTSIIDMRHIPISVGLLQHLQQATPCDCASEAVAYTSRESRLLQAPWVSMYNLQSPCDACCIKHSRADPPSDGDVIQEYSTDIDTAFATAKVKAVLQSYHRVFRCMIRSSIV